MSFRRLALFVALALPGCSTSSAYRWPDPRGPLDGTPQTNVLSPVVVDVKIGEELDP
jgi:hypothetical protein